MEEKNVEQNRRPLRRPVRYKINQPEKVDRIKNWMAVILIMMTLGVDLAEFGITWLGLVIIGGVLSSVLSFVAGFTFWVIFLILGVNSSSNTKNFTKKILVQLGAFLGEFIPVLDAIPIASFLWTIGMIITILMTWQEDRGTENTKETIKNAVDLMKSASKIGGKFKNLASKK